MSSEPREFLVSAGPYQSASYLVKSPFINESAYPSPLITGNQLNLNNTSEFSTPHSGSKSMPYHLPSYQKPSNKNEITFRPSYNMMPSSKLNKFNIRCLNYDESITNDSYFFFHLKKSLNRQQLKCFKNKKTENETYQIVPGRESLNNDRYLQLKGNKINGPFVPYQPSAPDGFSGDRAGPSYHVPKQPRILKMHNERQAPPRNSNNFVIQTQSLNTHSNTKEQNHSMNPNDSSFKEQDLGADYHKYDKIIEQKLRTTPTNPNHYMSSDSSSMQQRVYKINNNNETGNYSSNKTEKFIAHQYVKQFDGMDNAYSANLSSGEYHSNDKYKNQNEVGVIPIYSQMIEKPVESKQHNDDGPNKILTSYPNPHMTKVQVNILSASPEKKFKHEEENLAKSFLIENEKMIDENSLQKSKYANTFYETLSTSEKKAPNTDQKKDKMTSSNYSFYSDNRSQTPKSNKGSTSILEFKKNSSATDKRKKHEKNKLLLSLQDLSDDFTFYLRKKFKSFSDRLGCTCDSNLKNKETCSRAYKWLSHQYSHSDHESLKKIYNHLQERVECDEACLRQIQKDMPRTYPSHEFFKENSEG